MNRMTEGCVSPIEPYLRFVKSTEMPTRCSSDQREIPEKVVALVKDAQLIRILDPTVGVDCFICDPRRLNVPQSAQLPANSHYQVWLRERITSR
jgi:hypothetical protein